MIESVDFHPHFSQCLFNMDPLNDASFNITSQSGEIISSETLVSDSSISYINQNVIYRGI